MHDDLQERLFTAFPASTDAELIRAFREGILVADSVLESEPFLQSLVGRDLRGHLRRAAILFVLNEFCRVGDLPFESALRRMPRGNWHWLELTSGKFVAHLCRTDGPLAFPDETLTRQDDRLRNQGDLFEPNFFARGDAVDQISKVSAWLTFSGDAAGQLQHLCWAVPSADTQDWLAYIDILRRAAAWGNSTEGTGRLSKSVRLKFRDHIEEALSAKADSFGRSVK